MTDLVIVGAGLAGLLAANLAARRGASVTIVAQGRGSLSLSHGCIGLGSLPASDLAPEHPYHRAGKHRLKPAVDFFLEAAHAQGVKYLGTTDSVVRLPTAAGSVLSLHFVPATLAPGDLSHPGRTLVAGIQGFRDFDPSLVAAGLRARGVDAGSAELPHPGPPPTRDWYSTDIAARFERSWSAKEVGRLWRPSLDSAGRLGLPAVLGLTAQDRILSALEEALGITLFEIPTLPPSLPGLRLERALRRAALAAGCRLLEGSAAIGRIDGRSGGARTLGVSAVTPAGPRTVEAGATLLATGGVLNGGWRAERSGRLHESVFDLPIAGPENRQAWIGPSLFDPHPYDRYGLSVNVNMQPCDRDGRPFFPNVFACGGILGGADRRREQNRQGIDIVTAYAAVEAALS